MSASLEGSKIDLLDEEKVIQKKTKNADFNEGDSDNAIMAIIKYIIFTVKKKLIIERPEKFGGNLEYTNYQSLEKDVLAKKIHPLDIKNQVSKELIELLKPLNKIKGNLEELARKAYP